MWEQNKWYVSIAGKVEAVLLLHTYYITFYYVTIDDIYKNLLFSHTGLGMCQQV